MTEVLLSDLPIPVEETPHVLRIGVSEMGNLSFRFALWYDPIGSVARPRYLYCTNLV